ncbi:MAG TPA: hypothetical protein DEP69_03215, partial [Acidimicrobiaceae bacterium]|nr:hypothetical protein [Acidimicrobiaceae bacterium]
MSILPALFLGQAAAETVTDACGADPSWMCRQVFDLTDNSSLASLASWIVERPLKILLIFVLAWLARRLAHRGIARLVARLVSDRETEEE